MKQPLRRDRGAPSRQGKGHHIAAPKQQPWPGLVSKLKPRPDHGETSYQGSGRLAGRKALITGGDSGNGRTAAIAFAREGADVATNYLPAEEPDAQEVVDLIRAEQRNAVALPGDIRDEAFCDKLVANAVRQLGHRIGRSHLRSRRAQDRRRHPVGRHPGTRQAENRWWSLGA